MHRASVSSLVDLYKTLIPPHITVRHHLILKKKKNSFICDSLENSTIETPQNQNIISHPYPSLVQDSTTKLSCSLF